MTKIDVVEHTRYTRTSAPHLTGLTGWLVWMLLLLIPGPASAVTLTTAEAAYSVLAKNTTVQAPMSFTGSVGLFTGGILTMNSATIQGRVDYAGSINHNVSSPTITGGEFPNVALVS